MGIDGLLSVSTGNISIHDERPLMLIPTRAYEALLEAGLQLNALSVDSGADITLTDPRTREVAAFQVKTWHQPVGRAVVDRLGAHQRTDRRLLLIAPRFAEETRRAIVAHGWSWLTIPETGDPEGHIKLSDGPELRIGGGLAHSHDESRRPGPRAYRRFAVMRQLLTTPEPPTQTALAELAGVSQPRVSQVMQQLSALGLVEKGDNRLARRWRVADWEALLDHWLATYPGPGGVSTYWYGLDSVTEQAKSVAAFLSELAAHADDAPVVSGDAAAEQVAPYRRPQGSVIYARHGADLQTLGLTPAMQSASTLVLTVPEDVSIWPVHGQEPHWLYPQAPFGIADLTQVIWDLLRAPGPDADQAANALRGRLAAAVGRG